MIETFTDVRAGRLFTHGVEFIFTQYRFESRNFRRIGCAGTDPFRLGQRRVFGHNLDRDARGFARTL